MSPEAWSGIIGGSISVGAVVGLFLKGIFVTKTDCEKARATCQEATKESFKEVREELAEIKHFIIAIMTRLKINNDEIPRFEK